MPAAWLVLAMCDCPSAGLTAGAKTVRLNPVSSAYTGVRVLTVVVLHSSSHIVRSAPRSFDLAFPLRRHHLIIAPGTFALTPWPHRLTRVIASGAVRCLSASSLAILRTTRRAVVD